MKHTLLALPCIAALAACAPGGDTAPVPEGFALTGATIAPLAETNLCAPLGGAGTQPSLQINHTPVAGAPIRVRMYDAHSDGTVTEHNRVTVISEADGTTLADSGFLPPCNRTGGARDSSYRFDISAGGQMTTVTWGGYDSSDGEIVN